MSELQSFFEKHLKPQKGPYEEKQLYEIRYAAAALMIACAKSDFEEDPDEEEVIMEILKKTFEIEGSALDQLIVVADMDTNDNSLDRFAELVNEHYTEQDKLILLEDLWRVAHADGRVDRYEDRFIRRVADLIKMSDNDVRDAEQAARE
jgi:uncharacterized tellurite resistance protein B-like protein